MRFITARKKQDAGWVRQFSLTAHWPVIQVHLTDHPPPPSPLPPVSPDERVAELLLPASRPPGARRLLLAVKDAQRGCAKWNVSVCLWAHNVRLYDARARDSPGPMGRENKRARANSK